MGASYTITFKLTDTHGNMGRATAKVVVAHNPGETPVDSGVHYTVNGNLPVSRTPGKIGRAY